MIFARVVQIALVATGFYMYYRMYMGLKIFISRDVWFLQRLVLNCYLKQILQIALQFEFDNSKFTEQRNSVN